MLHQCLQNHREELLSEQVLDATELILQTFVLEFSLEQKWRRCTNISCSLLAVEQRMPRFYQQNDLCVEFKSEEGQGEMLVREQSLSQAV